MQLGCCLDFALHVEYRLSVAVQVSVLPLANLKVVQVAACFNSAVGFLDQSWPVDFLGKDSEDRDLTLLKRVRSDDSLLTELFAGFKGA